MSVGELAEWTVYIEAVIEAADADEANEAARAIIVHTFEHPLVIAIDGQAERAAA